MSKKVPKICAKHPTISIVLNMYDLISGCVFVSKRIFCDKLFPKIYVVTFFYL